MNRFLFLILGAILGFFVGTNQVGLAWRDYKPKVEIQHKNPPKNANIDFFLFWDVWDKISKNYYDKKSVDPQKMFYGAISGMVASLGDPYTVFLTPVQNNEVKQELSGEFQGIGAQLEMKNKRVTVTAALPSSPAQKAGITTGDYIVKVDGADTANWSLPETVSKIRGPAGSSVKLTIAREGEEKFKEISIVRSTIHVKSVEGKIQLWGVAGEELKMAQNGETCDNCKKIAYIKLTQFGDETNSEWLAAINNILQDTKLSPARGVVLDLRNNSGGYLTGAVFVASEFIKSGTIVVQDSGQDGAKQKKFEVNRKGVLTDIPIIVLINKGSASASEIVAGALRDDRGAKLVGETSFGKGTIQDAQELGGGAGLHITIAKWLTPTGFWVNGKGLDPDIKVSLDQNNPSRDFQLEKAVGELFK